MAFQGYTMPPPSLGLDVVTPIDNMDPATALELINIFPGAQAPTVRLGYTQFCNLANVTGGAATQVRMMRELPLANATTQLIVAQDTQLFSIDASGTGTKITRASGPYVSGKWNTEIFYNAIYLANSGGDAPQVYTGTGVAQDINATCRGGGTLITQLINVATYRNRLYFIQKDSFTMWYDKTVPAKMIGSSSTLDSYDFSGIMRRGGYLAFIGNYTNQNGINPQDYFVAVSSEGEIAVYAGSSPDAASTNDTWGLVAHFQIGKILGPKAFIRVNQDFWILTQQGIVPMSALFQTDPEQALNIVSQKINPIISQYATQVSLSEMWGGFFWAQGRRVYVTLPDSTTSGTLLVYSVDTKAWTQFALYIGDHCVAATRAFNLPFYGSTTGIVWQGETGYADAVTPTTTGTGVTFSMRSAFSFYGSRGNYKAFKDIRPLLKVKRGTSFSLGLDTDFNRKTIDTTVTTLNSNFTKWGSTGGSPTFTPWGSSWSSDITYIYDRHAVSGQGHCAAIRFGGSIQNSSLQIIGFEVRYDLGGQV
jgi:hypothetical protein